jgi:hypothetical protein
MGTRQTQSWLHSKKRVKISKRSKKQEEDGTGGQIQDQTFPFNMILPHINPDRNYNLCPGSLT